MKASVVDLRYRMNEVLKALERGESVTVLYRGTVKGTIQPALPLEPTKASEHPFFGSAKVESVQEVMDELRSSRYGL